MNSQLPTSNPRRTWFAPTVSENWGLGFGIRDFLLRLLRHVSRRKCGALAEEEVLHLAGHQLLRLLLPWHEAVFVQDHFLAVFPQLPCLGRDVLINPLSQLTRPRRCIKAGHVLLELDAVHGPAARVTGRGLGWWRSAFVHGSMLTRDSGFGTEDSGFGARGSGLGTRDSG